MPTIEIDYPRLRENTICTLCTGEKTAGCVVCWGCFHTYSLRNGTHPDVAAKLDARERHLAGEAVRAKNAKVLADVIGATVAPAPAGMVKRAAERAPVTAPIRTVAPAPRRSVAAAAAEVPHYTLGFWIIFRNGLGCELSRVFAIAANLHEAAVLMANESDFADGDSIAIEAGHTFAGDRRDHANGRWRHT